MNAALRLPFDQYQRYRLVADLLRELRAGGPPLRVLDVGGRTALLRAFLPDDAITLVDVESSDEAGLVLGSGAALPFADDSFDVVCAFDTLEHVPPPLRADFVSECGRVARRWVAIAGPYHSAEVARAEELLQRFMRDKLGVHHRYLEEHRDHGLPSRADTEEGLRARGAEVRSFGHANLERWLALMCVSFYMDDDPALRGLAAEVHAFYNERLYASDHAEPVYRHVVLAAFDGAPLPKAAGLLGEPVAPRGVLEGFTELFGELAAFDRERDEWRAERKRIAKVSEDLALDLEGHEQTLAAMEADLADERATRMKLEDDLDTAQAEARKAIDALEADLAEHDRTIEVLRADAEQLRAEAAAVAALRAKERGEAEAALAAVQADIAGHAEALRDLRQELKDRDAAAERERAAAAASIHELETDLARHRASLEHERAQLAAHVAELESLSAAVASERAAFEEVRRALEADLAGHRDALAATRADADGVRAELDRTRAEARAIQAELVRSNEAAAGLGRTLAEREADLAELRALLRSRWLNAKRAFGLKKPQF